MEDCQRFHGDDLVKVKHRVEAEVDERKCNNIKCGCRRMNNLTAGRQKSVLKGRKTAQV